ncbi:SDR family NAD(P)-dependent oxidoreductase [Pokkaliibacter sp. CJK22405]|uniref:SDR family NAD(P)-dependent oxidoreductase n=1 Tax=Pokkaliibacter sp. CJK22405 TaxID=3384615 RepID=UPI0039848971
MMDHSLPWKQVWITGASQGLGRAVAEQLAREGIRVYASARSEDKLRELAEESRQWAGEIIPLPVDITDAESVHQAVNQMCEHSGPPDLAILNAGTHIPTPVKSFSADDIQTLMNLNVVGTSRCLEALLPYCLEKNAGQIAVVASVAGYRGLPTAGGYGATKAALNNLIEALSIELISTDVRLQVINPGFVRTPLTDKNPFPMPSLMEPEEAAHAMIMGLCSRKPEIRFPRGFGWAMAVLRLLPRRLYRWLVARGTGFDQAVEGKQGGQ